MPNGKPVQRLLSTALALSFFTSSIPAAFAAEGDTRWVFPGQTLPAGVSYTPLKISSDSSADVQVISRDWFLLKRTDMMTRNLTGPTLTDSNAQVYYRIVAGTILKTAMLKMGMKPSEAQIYLDRVAKTKKDFNTTPLSEFGDLPGDLNHYYKNWNKLATRTTWLPYLALPLAIANNESSFQHFFSAPVVNDSPDKKCSSITTAAPIGVVQSKIDDRRNRARDLVQILSRADDAVDHSNHEMDRLSVKTKGLSEELSQRSTCLDVIRERIAHGTAMPSAQCLADSKAVMTEANRANDWTKFANTPNMYLQNAKGDYTVQQELDASSKVFDTQYQVAKKSLDDISEVHSKAVTDLGQNQETLRKLQEDRQSQTTRIAELQKTIQDLNLELPNLIALRNKMDARQLTAEEAAQADKVAPQSRVETIKKVELPNSQKELSTVQFKKAETDRQISVVTDAVVAGKASIAAIEGQLGDDKSGLAAKVAALDKLRQENNAKYLAATDAYNFSKYIIQALQRKVILSTEARDTEVKSLNQEQINNSNLKNAAELAKRNRESSEPGLLNEANQLEARLANYRSDSHMGSFLELDCPIRAQMDAEKMGVFVSRAQVRMGVPSALASDQLVDGGKWGMFNLDFNHFQKEIESGILLNIPEYVKLAVNHSFANLDASMNQYLDPSFSKCSSINTFGTSLPDLMANAYAMWNDGSEDSSRTKLYCRAEAKVGFISNLSRFLSFEGSVLDQALPKANSADGDDQIERQAIKAINEELRFIAGQGAAKTNSDDRRDDLFRALVKILSYNYDAATAKSQDLQTKQNIRMASSAPGNLAADELQPFTVGAQLPVQQASKIYRIPIAKNDFEANVRVVVDDAVRIVLPDNNSPDAVRAGWLKVQLLDKSQQILPGEYWLPAASLVSPKVVNLTQATLATTAASSSGNGACQVNRLVKVVGTLYERTSEAKAVQVGASWRMDARGLPRVKPVDPRKLYIACEVYGEADKPVLATIPPQWQSQGGIDFTHAIAIRVIEASAVTGQDGVVRYAPLAADGAGGYVSAWRFSATDYSPRIFVVSTLNDDGSVVK